jgi:crotonobetainyl-CoA:carnitine CoA-transferase CaiB-like acyl-CoA transferase
MAVGTLGVDPGVPGDRYRQSPLRNAFRCADGKWIIGVHHPEDKYWPRLCRATGQEGLLEDPRFADEAGRHAHCGELVGIFEAVFAQRTRDEWMELLPSAGLMFGPVNRVEEVLTDPQALANEYVVTYAHPVAGRVTVPGYPAHFSVNGAGVRGPAPALGEHTDEVLLSLGYSQDDLRALRDRGVIR